MVMSDMGSGGPSSYMQPHLGGGLPGLSVGQGVSLQKGGGGGTHYGFTAGGGLAGGQASYPTNCAVPQSGGSGQLNVPVGNSPPGMMTGGRRKSKSKSKSNKSKSNKSKSNKNKSRSRR